MCEMAKMVNMADSVYDELDKLKGDVMRQKRHAGQKERTTYSELVMMLINLYKGLSVGQ
jgi:predicted CopG family antitoxin